MSSTTQAGMVRSGRRFRLLGAACVVSALLHAAVMQIWLQLPPTRPPAAEPLPLQLQLHTTTSGNATAAAPMAAPEQPGPQPATTNAQPHNTPREVLQVKAAVIHQAPLLPVHRPAVQVPSLQRAPLLQPQPESGSASASEHAQVLQRWLEQHRFYPRAARRAGIEGVVHLRFQLQRNGMPTQAQVAISSGAPLLDRAALALLRQASPLPWPADLEATAIEVDVPVAYALRSGAPPR